MTYSGQILPACGYETYTAIYPTCNYPLHIISFRIHFCFPAMGFTYSLLSQHRIEVNFFPSQIHTWITLLYFTFFFIGQPCKACRVTITIPFSIQIPINIRYRHHHHHHFYIHHALVLPSMYISLFVKQQNILLYVTKSLISMKLSSIYYLS